MTHLVNTITLARASGVTTTMIRKLVHDGVLTVVVRERRREHHGRGRPTMWFDYDTAMDALELDKGSFGSDSAP